MKQNIKDSTNNSGPTQTMQTMQTTTTEPKDSTQSIIKAGTLLAERLGLKQLSGFDPPRWEMGGFYGTKTSIGVYGVIQDLAEKARKIVEEGV